MTIERGEAISKEEILKRASEAIAAGETAEWKEGKCSKCGQTVSSGNFCYLCSATFLKQEQIDKGETIH